MKKYLILLLLLIPSLAWGACTYTTNGDGSGTLSNCSIDANSDYCMQVGSTACTLGSQSYDMYVPYISTNARDVFLRYKANIPKNATISSAYLTFTPKTTSTAAGAVSIDLLEEDNCAVFITTDNTASRVSTNAPSAVSWSHGSSDWVADVTENSPDIKTLVQAWIDRESYAYDSYIGLYVATVSGSNHIARHGTTYGPVLVVNYTGGDPVLSEVYMADPHVRTKQYLYIQLFNTTSTQKLKVTLDGTDVTGSPFSNIAGQSVAGEQKVLVDYAALTAGEHTLRAVILNASDEEYASSVWTRTWTTTHDGAPHMGIDEENNFVIGGVKKFLISDFLWDISKWTDNPETGDLWNAWFNTSNFFGNVTGLTSAQTYVASSVTGTPAYRIGPAHTGLNFFTAKAPQYAVIDGSFAETFEGSGTILGACGDPLVGFCWTTSGTVDFDYGTALVGSQSLQVTGDSYAQLLMGNMSKNCTGAKTPYSCCTGTSTGCSDESGVATISFRVKPTTRSGVTDLVTFVDVTGEVVGKLKINASNKLELHHCSGGTCSGTDLATGTYDFATNTEHSVWVRFETEHLVAAYHQGYMYVYAAAAGQAKPASPDASILEEGSGQGAVKYIRLASSDNNVMVFDSVSDDITDMKEYMTGLKDTATYPKLVGWSWDDEPDMGSNGAWNYNHYLWKEFVRTQDTKRPVFGGLYGYNYDLQSLAANTNRGTDYMLYMTNAAQHGGVKTLFADAAVADLYFHEYSLRSDPLTNKGIALEWYPDFNNYVNSLDVIINGMYNLIPISVVPEVTDLSESLCYNNTTYYAFACPSISNTMYVPIGNASGALWGLWSSPSTRPDGVANTKYVQFGGDSSKVGQILEVRLNEGTSSDNYKFQNMYPRPHPNYNSHIVILELNSTFDSDTLANNDAIVECTSITGAYGSVTCTATGDSTATVITGTAGKVPRLGEGERYYRVNATSRPWTPMPTPQGLKSSMWLSMIHGAKYMTIFPYWTLKYKNMLDVLKTFKDDVDVLQQAIFAPVATTKFTVPTANKGGWATVSATDETGTARVDYTVRTYGGIDYVFAGRVMKHDGDAAETINVAIPVVGVTAESTISRYGESGSPTAGAGTITDSFTPHQVRIYQVGAASSNFALSVVKAGDGSGTVVSDIGDIDCGATCSDDYATGTSVTLTASVVGNNALGAWSGGGCSGNGATCTVSVTEATEVTKYFTDTTPRNFNVTISYAGTGTGVTDPVEGVHAYANGATATTTQTPTSPSTFTGWSGTCGCTGTGACAPTISADCTIIATWTYPTSYYLTVQYPQNGELITSDSGGINCGRENYECAKSYTSGTVTLTCETALGYYNCTFSGDCTGSTCATEMTANKTVAVVSTNGRCVTLGSGGTMTLGAGGEVNPPNCNASTDKLGTDDISGNPPAINPDIAWCSPYTPSCYGNLVKAYVRHTGVVESSAKICVYKDNGDLVANAADTKVACSGDITSSSTEWVSADMDAGDDLTTGNYWVCLGVKSGGNAFAVDRSSTTSPFAYKTASGMYASPPDNLNGYTTTSGARFSTYVTVGP